MREILFRGKLKYSDDWVYGDLFHLEGDCTQIFARDDPHAWRNDVVDPNTVGQFTGLLDKYGTKVFEGDVIRMNQCQEDLAEVCFGEFKCIDMETESATDTVIGWHYKVIPTDALSQVEPFSLPFQMNEHWAKACSYEVIGNIHDNPEPLKGGAE